MSMSSSSSKVPRNNRGTAPHSNPPAVPRLCSDTLGRFSGGGNFGSSPEDPRLPSSLCVVLDAAPRRGLEEAQEAHSGDMSTMQTMSPHALSDTRDREIEGAHLAAVSKSCPPGHGLTSGCHIGVKRTPLGRSTSLCPSVLPVPSRGQAPGHTSAPRQHGLCTIDTYEQKSWKLGVG